MEGKTHKLGGVLCALAGYRILESNGMLIEDVSPLLQLAVIYPFAIYGSVFSDLDHGWQSVPARDPISYVVNKVLHLTTGVRKKTNSKNFIVSLFDARHRSWQTHSDLFLFSLIFISVMLLNSSMIGVSGTIFKLISMGFIIGVVSHLILDSLTPEGIWFIIPSIIKQEKVSFRLVPKTKFFATGGPWEKLVRAVMSIAIAFYMISIAYSYCPYRFVISF